MMMVVVVVVVMVVVMVMMMVMMMMMMKVMMMMMMMQLADKTSLRVARHLALLLRAAHVNKSAALSRNHSIFFEFLPHVL